MLLKQITTPALYLDMDKFDQNQKVMKDLIKGCGGALRPHYKSHKCVEIAKRQIADGAKGITCAKLGEARDLVEAGFEDVLIANQIAGPAKLAQAASLANCCKLTVAADSVLNVKQLEEAAAAQNAKIFVLIEYEIGMNRCGVSTPQELHEIAKAIDASEHLVFEGIQAYAGHLSHEIDHQIRIQKGNEIEQRLKQAKAYLEERGLPVNQVSGCSTASVSDHAIAGGVYTEFQPGSYIFMDVAYRTLKDLPFQNALFVLATVVSNAGGRTIVDAGCKAISSDQESPVFPGFENCQVSLSEEHSSAVLPPGSGPAVGDTISMIPGHCCTCINLYDTLYLVRDGKVVDKIPITSRGKSQ
jgi:D-serine deaminase-like pyridoxal phosphate-dependent protein